MAQSKIYSNQPVANGLAVSCIGDGIPQTYSGNAQNIASGDSLTFFQNLDGRYRDKGGPNGSGNFEWL